MIEEEAILVVNQQTKEAVTQGEGSIFVLCIYNIYIETYNRFPLMMFWKACHGHLFGDHYLIDPR